VLPAREQEGVYLLYFSSSINAMPIQVSVPLSTARRGRVVKHFGKKSGRFWGQILTQRPATVIDGIREFLSNVGEHTTAARGGAFG
jgi:hypothetical protein